MSSWQYEAGRKICLENVSRGDFSNLGETPKTAKEKRDLQRWALEELNKLDDIELEKNR